jgi:hypothetical protein
MTTAAIDITVRDGETEQGAALRLGKRADETWEAFRARRLTEDATLRQDARDGEEGDTPSAEQARAGMLARMGAAPVADAGDDGLGSADADRARRDMVKRKTDAWKTGSKKKKPEAGPVPPESASEAAAEGDDDDDEGEEEEADAEGAQAAHAARVKDAWKAKRA